MRYLKLVPLLVSVTLHTFPSAYALPVPMDQAEKLPVGDTTLGLVTPAAVPNLKLPNVGGGGAGIPPAGTASAVPVTGSTPNMPGLSSLPGSSSLPSNGLLQKLSALQSLTGPLSGKSGKLTPSGGSKAPTAGGKPGTGLKAPAPPSGMAPKPAGLPSAPSRRSPEPGHGNGRIQPRQFHSADFSAAASPNGTIPQVPSPAQSEEPATAAKRDARRMDTDSVVPNSAAARPASEGIDLTHSKRAGKSSGRGSKKNVVSSKPERPQKKTPGGNTATGGNHAENGANTSSSDSSGPAAGMADLVKTVGAAPKTVSPVVNSMPAVPDTPVTFADTTPTVDRAGTTVAEAAPQAHKIEEEKELAPEANAGAYPHAPGYNPVPPPPVPAAGTVPSPPAPLKSKRQTGAGHTFVLDTDPLLPPSADAQEGKDPSMGVIDIDSNRKPDPVPSAPVPVKPASITHAPTSTTAVDTSTMSIYQPSEPGYQSIGYPTPAPSPP